MNNKIKAVFFDVDGTLLSHRLDKIPESAAMAVDMMRSAGIKVFLATGRSKMVMAKMHALDDLRVDGVVSLNGALCYDASGIIYECPLEPEDILCIEKYADKHHLPLQYMEADRTYATFSDSRMVDSLNSVHTSLPKISSRKGTAAIYQMIAYESRSSLKDLDDSLKNAVITGWADSASDIINRHAGKDSGVAAVLHKYNIPVESSLAFGDGFNDIPLLRAAGIGIAVGGSDKLLIKEADMVCDTIENDGIYKALKGLNVLS